MTSGRPSPTARRGERPMTRTIVTLGGLVQRVGFRFTVLRIARRHAVAGTVRNLRAGERVEIDAEGADGVVDAFIDDALAHPPRGARVDSVERRTAEPRGLRAFTEAPTA
ncbi:MAG TPA: acylphosphatase [Candidatus Elarobacter sp.]|nr:acylphosphatase [Dongiaceae bacterium]HZW53555.1 acylphosphatase [Candidatus Elarobacter sp.]